MYRRRGSVYLGIEMDMATSTAEPSGKTYPPSHQRMLAQHDPSPPHPVDTLSQRPGKVIVVDKNVGPNIHFAACVSPTPFSVSASEGKNVENQWILGHESGEITPLLARQTCGFLAMTPIAGSLVDRIEQEVGTLKEIDAWVTQPGRLPFSAAHVVESLESLYYPTSAFVTLVRNNWNFADNIYRTRPDLPDILCEAAVLLDTTGGISGVQYSASERLFLQGLVHLQLNAFRGVLGLLRLSILGPSERTQL
ncbi:hypothetical protein M427DRAFT_144398 [Gonapodya prolifera JEL478]|uniref:Uncharacterized protein n=1 Tax=Gonapodya prolifera (strain JEL478) TaxID=1344416 RepID=A0A139AKP3_GONPJ|nr:hypothetical protein M427DRAFT_144398 [Gonapodya prolifera JEL478]|eukprot:KXS17104.1 hypothetical protein M427DRAFT_144398 [Gonapodya prolifera JEL478]